MGYLLFSFSFFSLLSIDLLLLLFFQINIKKRFQEYHQSGKQFSIKIRDCRGIWLTVNWSQSKFARIIGVRCHQLFFYCSKSNLIVCVCVCVCACVRVCACVCVCVIKK